MGHLSMSCRAALQKMVTNPCGLRLCRRPWLTPKGSAAHSCAVSRSGPLTHSLSPRWISEEVEFPLHPLHSQ